MVARYGESENETLTTKHESVPKRICARGNQMFSGCILQKTVSSWPNPSANLAGGREHDGRNTTLDLYGDVFNGTAGSGSHLSPGRYRRRYFDDSASLGNVRVSLGSVYGPATEDAIREFQEAHGLEADGLVGPATYRALLSRDIPTSRGDFSTLLVRRLISVAQEYIGVPYLFGGSTPSGFDCSGFVQFAAKAAGLVLPRSADEQYHMGRSVSRSQMQPGDLVFFSTYTDGVSHSGIYLGGDRFISSTSSRGVVIDSLSEGYWNDCYVGARRLI